jgi:kynureninase
MVYIITPENPDERGAQASLICKKNGKKIHGALTESGIIADWREPEVLRMAATPLYNSFLDVYTFGNIFKEAIIKNS